MLLASPLRSFNDETEPQKQEKEEEAQIADFSTGNWLDTIDFDDLLDGISNDKLKDFQIDLQNFSDETMEVKGRSPEMRNATMAEETTSASQETITKISPCRKEARKSRKTTTSGKKKVKVDWTPDLHRRFVQAVEQLGIDKAVPSRILELMGIDCLTRHNVASHLQKYRSQRKHLLGREAEAASWNQRRRMYAAAAAGPAPVNKESGVNNPWITPTIGIPTVPNFGPLNHHNVWGHPSVDHSYMAMWPKPLWLPHHHVMSPCYPPVVMPVPGIPPVPMMGLGVPSMHQGPGLPQPPSDFHPSKESVDAAIGEVLSKPWMPLPLGLTPPSIDSVLGELQAQGISKIPPGG